MSPGEEHLSDVRVFLARSLSHAGDYECEVLGRRFHVHPQVMSPRYSYSPLFTIRHWDETAFPGATVLDMGCGCGVLAVFAALAGAARVVAVDVNPDAIRLTRRNAEEQGVGDRVAAVLSDGFSGVSGPPFDLVLFNAPYFDHPFDPAVPLTRGVFDPGHAFLRHVLGEAPRFLRARGRLLLVLGSSGLSGAPQGAEALGVLLAEGPMRVVAERSEVRGHRRTLYTLARAEPSPAPDRRLDLERRVGAGELSSVDELEASLRAEPLVSWRADGAHPRTGLPAETTVLGLTVSTGRAGEPPRFVTTAVDETERVLVHHEEHGDEAEARAAHLLTVLRVLRGELARPRLL